MNTKGKLISLEEWDRATFSRPHSIATLRAWARSGNIRPRPKKVGRQYFVSEHAEYVESSALEVQHDDPVVRGLVSVT